MNCSNCGSAVAPNSSFCSICGAAVSAEVLGNQGAAFCNVRYRQFYSLWRVGILGLITFGTYYLYWSYTTWKSLSTETQGRQHYPFWHAVAMAFAPIYNLFVAHNHFETIKDIQSRSQVESNINSIYVVLLLVLSYALAIVFAANNSDSVSFLIFLIPVPYAGVMVWGQANLNKYWDTVTGGQARSAGTGAGEVLISIAGSIYFILVVVGVVFPGPGVGSVFEAGTITPIQVGTSRIDSIDSSLDIDAYSFEATQGVSYTIEVGFDVGTSVVDPLEDPVLGLWDTDGNTVLEFNDDYEGSRLPRIDWVAPTTGLYYLTVENADLISTGEYTLLVTPR